MRRYRSALGDERLWFERSELETIIEDELRNASLFPTAEDPAVDVERFLESHLKVTLDQYADLEDDVLGLTEFRRGQPPVVLVNRDLTGSAMDSDWAPPGVRGRWRATLAHEAAHVVLHRVLFELDPGQEPLFEADLRDPDGHRVMRCLKRQVSFTREAWDWREVQANRGMAALLMPRDLFLDLARSELPGIGGDSVLAANSPEVVKLADHLAALFAVSRQAAAIRLETLGLVGRPGEQPLL
ncbi:MAG TPA: ImmA/IrrE family metallo-endopeptidase [Gemmatimonadales bacterium]|nr:ImmA/IrrE family metallo-endopeptidase [Gemmatimonadales bacterium]